MFCNILKFSIISSLFLYIKCDYTCPNVNNSNVNIDRRLNKNNLRVVQYNVEWLFIDYYSNFDCPGACTWKNESEALIHLDYVSNVINKLNPDIINLCEVEGCDELNMVIDNMNNKNNYLPYLIKGTDTYTGQNVGMITKINPLINLYRLEEKYSYPINGSLCGYNGTIGSTGLSKHYITEFYINNIYIALIGIHLLANPKDPLRCAEREAQSQILQPIIYSYIAIGYEVIVLGDFNDFDDLVLDINNNIPTSQVLNIMKGNFGDYKDMYQLYTIANNISKNERYTDWYDANLNCISDKEDYSMIDHILISKNLIKYIKSVYIYHGYDEYCGKYNSDHFPIVLDFDFIQ